MRIELVFMLPLLTFAASLAPPLLCITCHAKRIFLSGSRAGSYLGWVVSNIDVSAYFKTFIRRALAGQEPSGFGVVMALSPPAVLVTLQAILPESSTEIITLGRT